MREAVGERRLNNGDFTELCPSCIHIFTQDTNNFFNINMIYPFSTKAKS